MHFITLFTSILVAVTLSNASPAPAGPSPSCSYTCPDEDKSDFALGVNSNEDGSLFCSYPLYTGEDQFDYYCIYDSATGVLTTDHDTSAGTSLCPDSAATSCTGRRRSHRNALPRFPAPTGAVSRDAKPEMMKLRSSLKKRSPSADAVKKA